jgi:hypothetical protein
MHPLLALLTGGDRRSIGQSAEVVTAVLDDPALFPIVFDGMLADDQLIRMRAADAVEKITAQQPELLTSYTARILNEVAAVPQAEVRWHVAQLIERLTLDGDQQRQAVAILEEYLDDRSVIVRVNALQALATLAECDVVLRPIVIVRIAARQERGAPAEQSRARKLLAWLKQHESENVSI